jgi:autotransporter-associated beta strand protein
MKKDITCFALNFGTVFLLAPLFLLGTTYTWVGGTSNLNSSSNWSPSSPPGPPGANDTALFSGGGNHTPSASGAFSVAEIDFTGSSTYTISSSTNQFFTITGNSGGLGVLNLASSLQIFRSLSPTGAFIFSNNASADSGNSGLVQYQLGNAITSGALSFTGTSDGGAAHIDIENGSAVSISNNSPLNIGTISTSNYSNSTINFVNSGGGLIFGGNGQVSGQATIQSQISGPGSLEVDLNGSALTTAIGLTNSTNSYSNGTTLTNGILNVSAGGCLGSGTIDFNGGVLQLGGTASTMSQAATVSNSSTIDLDGNSGWTFSPSSMAWTVGTLTLESSSGSSQLDFTYSPTSSTGVGTLSIDQDLTVTINSGASLGADIADATSIDLMDSTSHLVLSSATAEDVFGMISGSGPVKVTGGGDWTFHNSLSYSGLTTIDTNTSAVFEGNVSSLGDISLGSGASVDFEVVGSSGSYSGAISNSGQVLINQNGHTGTLTFGQANSYSGGTSLAAGALNIAASDYLGTGEVTFTGGTLQLGGTADTLSQAANITDNSAIDLNGHSGWTFSPTTLTWTSGVLTLESSSGTSQYGITYSPASVSGVGSLVIDAGITATVPSGISLGADTSNATSLDLTSSTSELILSSGASEDIYGAISGSGSSTQAVKITGGGDWTFHNTLSYTGETVVDTNTSVFFEGDVSALNKIDLASGSSVDFEVTGSETFSGTLTGSGAVLVNNNGGTGTLTISGSNNFSGGLSLYDGELSVAAGDSLGTSGVTFQGGTLQLTGNTTVSQGIETEANSTIDLFGNTETFSGNFTGASGVALTLESTDTSSQSVAILQGNNSGWTGGILKIGEVVTAQIAAGSNLPPNIEFPVTNNSSFLDIEAPSNTTITSNISGAGALEINVNLSTSIVTLNPTLQNTFSEGVVINNGCVSVSDAAFLGTGEIGLAGGNLKFTGDTSTVSTQTIALSANGIIDAKGNEVNLVGALGGTNTTLTLQSSTGSGDFILSSTSNDLWGGTLQVGGGTGKGVTVFISESSNLPATTLLNAGTLDIEVPALQSQSFANVMSGAGNLSINSMSNHSGTVTLSGGNTFSGATSVDAGELIFTGALNGLNSSLAISSGAKVDFEIGSTDTFNGAISGNGSVSVNQNGSTGTLTLTKQSGFSGGLTLYDGAVSVANGNYLGTGPFTFEGGSLAFTGANTSTAPGIATEVNSSIDLAGSSVTFSGDLTGANGTTLTFESSSLSGLGLAVFEGNNSGWTGGTIKAENSVKFQAASGANLPPTVDLSTSFNLLDIEAPSNTTVTSNIEGLGGLTVNVSPSSSIVTLNPTIGNSFSGGVSINNGTLAVANGAFLGTGEIALSGGNLQFLGGVSLPSSQTIALSANGAIDAGSYGSSIESTISGTNNTLTLQTSTGPGGITLTSTSNSLWGGTLQINRGVTLFVNEGSNLPNKTTLSGGTLDIEALTPQIFSNNFSGNGTVATSGEVTLSGANTYSGTTNVGTGSLTFTGPLSGLSSSVALSSETSVDFEVVGADTFSGAISGDGSIFINKNGPTGSLTLSGSSNFSGPMTISNGSVVFSGNTSGITGSIDIPSTSLTFQANSDETFSGSLSGNGSLFKTGPYSLTLSGNNASFTGQTAVNQGDLVVNSTLGGSLNVVGGILSGSGTILGNVDIASAGTISPGNSIGTLSINGDYQQEGAYLVELNAQGESSLINVGGKATLSSGSEVLLIEDSVDLAAQYHILHANGGLSGTFSGITLENGFIIPTTNYTKNDVFLTFQPQISFVTKTFNQRQVALQLEKVKNLKGALAKAVTALVHLDESKILRALDQISGQQYTNVLVTAELANQRFSQDLYNPIRKVVTSSLNCHDPSEYLLWLQGGGGRFFAEGNTNAEGFHINSYEIEAGAQKGISNCWTLGGAFGYLKDEVNYKVGGSHHRHNFIGSIYGIYQPGCWYSFSELILGGATNQVKRSLEIGTLHNRFESHVRNFQGTYYGELGIDLNISSLLIQPFVGCEAGFYTLHHFKEKGTSPFKLTIHGKNHRTAYSCVGLHLTSPDPFWNKFTVSLDGSCRYRWTSMDNTDKHQFQQFGTTFKTKGFQMQRLSFISDLYLATNLMTDLEIYLQVQGNWWSQASAFNIIGGLHTHW